MKPMLASRLLVAVVTGIVIGFLSNGSVTLVRSTKVVVTNPCKSSSLPRGVLGR